MNKQVDARGMNCPLPVIHTKKALEEIETGAVTTIVDNEVAKENVLKLAKSMDLEANVKQDQGNYYIDIFKESQTGTTVLESSVLQHKTEDKEGLIILITKDKLGTGSDELGALLMSSYLYTLTEVLPCPTCIIFLNGAVNLTVEGSESLEHIRTLETKGVEILSCGTCLDYFGLNDKLAVGSVSNMYTIVEKLNKIGNVITL
ncbi:MAG: sulfurtransferase-like selenium metabolism protein YedF [Bacillota bacterium]|jgi:selenium metabolism protein YedF|nr:sulfurtransferase-like selenium metabolism protein YedF [Bacillota bacterium]